MAARVACFSGAGILTELDGLACKQLKSFVEQIERLEDERATLGADIRKLLAEARTAGFDTKIMRQVIKLKKMDTAEREGQQDLLELYKQAVGIGVHESWF